MQREVGTDQLFGEMQLAAGDKIPSDVVNQDLHAIAFDDPVIAGFGVIEGKIILEAGASAAIHSDSQIHTGKLALTGQSTYPLDGAVADGDGFLGFDHIFPEVQG